MAIVTKADLLKTGDKVRENILGQMETNTWEVSSQTKGKDKERCNTKALELNILEVGRTTRSKATGLRHSTMDNMLESSSTT